MENKYLYLVANPFGVFLARCNTMEEVRSFIIEHLDNSMSAYEVIFGKKFSINDYQVRDLTEIPIYNQVSPVYDRSHEECCECKLENKEPQECPGHPAGPVSCKFFQKRE